MKILVTGATGFIGAYVINELLARGHEVIASSTSTHKAEKQNWFGSVTYVEHQLDETNTDKLFEKFHRPEALIHLAWGGLSNFKDEQHVVKELPLQKAFLYRLISDGLTDITVIGTCLEYGMKEGELHEEMEAHPTIAYPKAKNQLRIYLEELIKGKQISLKWVRLFYMYGNGQSKKSILPQLQTALENGDETFNMSPGEQVRDYLPVETVAKNIVIFALQQKIDGIINCCSNQPVSVKQLVTNYLKQKKKEIKLNLGFYDYTDYEPFKFWGNNQKQNNIIRMNPIEAFKQECKERIESFGNNAELKQAAHQFNVVSNRDKYSYNFTWMGRPIIQYPQDMVMMQELIWKIQPDLIIETGIAHGGSLIYYASIMELIGKGEILGVDIDIRDHNRKEIEAHPMFKRIKMIQGSAIDPAIVAQVKKHAEGKKTVMVSLDSNHTHDHVLEELRLYADFTTVGSYCVVFDTIVEDLPAGFYDRPWDVGNNPKTAVFEYLKNNSHFEIDKQIDNKLLISVAPDGYLKRVK